MAHRDRPIPVTSRIHFAQPSRGPSARSSGEPPIASLLSRYPRRDRDRFYNKCLLSCGKKTTIASRQRCQGWRAYLTVDGVALTPWRVSPRAAPHGPSAPTRVDQLRNSGPVSISRANSSCRPLNWLAGPQKSGPSPTSCESTAIRSLSESSCSNCSCKVSASSWTRPAERRTEFRHASALKISWNVSDDLLPLHGGSKRICRTKHQQCRREHASPGNEFNASGGA